jgi:hypothetical protein
MVRLKNQATRAQINPSHQPTKMNHRMRINKPGEEGVDSTNVFCVVIVITPITMYGCLILYTQKRLLPVRILYQSFINFNL